jgi:hypothetical protein
MKICLDLTSSVGFTLNVKTICIRALCRGAEKSVAGKSIKRMARQGCAGETAGSSD